VTSAAVPGASTGEPDTAASVLEVTDLKKHFHASQGLGGGGGLVYAVDGVSLSIGKGEVLGLVGESGSGKSTVGRCIMRLLEPTSGQIKLNGVDITHHKRRQMRPLRRDMHMVFQDPYSSLNPRMTAGQIVAEPLRLHGVARGSEAEDRVADLFDKVGLGSQMRFRYPHELSGGQRQRIGLARALVLQPSLVIADEPVSALDVSVQASIINLLMDLQQDMGFSCLFITHALSAVEFIADRVAVMYLGKIVEHAPREELFAEPKHPYTQALLSAVLAPDPSVQRGRSRVLLPGDIPSPLTPPSGCSFHTRCPVVEERNKVEEPSLRRVGGRDHWVSCHLVDDDGNAPDILGGQQEQDRRQEEQRVHD
jgi:oligopeptide transport system ATP-binding protein